MLALENVKKTSKQNTPPKPYIHMSTTKYVKQCCPLKNSLDLYKTEKD